MNALGTASLTSSSHPTLDGKIALQRLKFPKFHQKLKQGHHNHHCCLQLKQFWSVLHRLRNLAPRITVMVRFLLTRYVTLVARYNLFFVRYDTLLARYSTLRFLHTCMLLTRFSLTLKLFGNDQHPK